jgi:hypothetical protein
MEGLIESIDMMNSIPATALIQFADRAVCTADYQLLHYCFTVVFGLEALLTKITVMTTNKATIEASNTPRTATTKTNRATPTTITEASQDLMILA